MWNVDKKTDYLKTCRLGQNKNSLVLFFDQKYFENKFFLIIKNNCSQQRTLNHKSVNNCLLLSFL